MKIPTQQINVKRTALVVAGMAVVTGMAVPTATFAHGGDRAERNGSWSHDKRHGGHERHWNKNASSWWEKITAEDFSNWNNAKLAKIDRYVAKNNLSVENGAALREAVDSNATVLTEALTALEALRESTGEINDATNEEREALKSQSVATFSAYYDYKLSFYDYSTAIKAAANQSGAKVDASLDETP